MSWFYNLDIRHVYRGAELRRRYGRLGGTSLFNIILYDLDYIFISPKINLQREFGVLASVYLHTADAPVSMRD